MKKIVQFSTVHPAFDIRVFHRECCTLAAAGYETCFVTPHERDEVVQGVHICAVAPPRNRVDRILRTTWQVFRRCLAENGVVYHFHDPELIPIGILLKLWGKRVIYDAHEDTPRDILMKHYIPKVLRHPVSALVEWVEMAGMLAFDGLISATPAIGRRFPNRKNVTVQNFPIQDEYPTDPGVPFAQRPNNLIYAGLISEGRGLKEMIQATSLLPLDLGARLVLAGWWVPSDLKAQAQRLNGWSSVNSLGTISRQDLLKEYGRARLALVLFHPGPNHTEAQPAKLFEYMLAGLPVVASNFPHWRKFVADENCGILVNPTDPADIAKAVHWILTHPEEAEAMGKRGQNLIMQRYNWNVEAANLLALYERLTGLRRSPGDRRHATATPTQSHRLP